MGALGFEMRAMVSSFLVHYHRSERRDSVGHEETITSISTSKRHFEFCVTCYISDPHFNRSWHLCKPYSKGLENLTIRTL